MCDEIATKTNQASKQMHSHKYIWFVVFVSNQIEIDLQLSISKGKFYVTHPANVNILQWIVHLCSVQSAFELPLYL